MGEPSEAGLSPSPLRLLPQVALETLLLRGPQKPQTHPLTDYRYTGDCSQVPRGFCPAETPRASQPRGHALLVPPPAAPAFPAGPVVSGATGAGGGGAKFFWLGPTFPLPSASRGLCPAWRGMLQARKGRRWLGQRWMEPSSAGVGRLPSPPPLGWSASGSPAAAAVKWAPHSHSPLLLRFL